MQSSRQVINEMTAIMGVVFWQIVLLIAISGEYCEQYRRQFSGNYIELLPFR